MARLINIVEGAISFTLKFLENSKQDPTFDAEKYLIGMYKINEKCASRFYRPIYWNIFATLTDNPIGKIEKSTNPNRYELLTSTIIPNEGRTWYNYVGDWPILLISSAFFAVGIRRTKDATKG